MTTGRINQVAPIGVASARTGPSREGILRWWVTEYLEPARVASGVRRMHRIRENYPTMCAAMPVACLLACEDMADHVRDFGVLRDLQRVVEAQTETLFASTRGCLLVGR